MVIFMIMKLAVACWGRGGWCALVKEHGKDFTNKNTNFCAT
jgi:hypothetical protein